MADVKINRAENGAVTSVETPEGTTYPIGSQKWKLMTAPQRTENTRLWKKYYATPELVKANRDAAISGAVNMSAAQARSAEAVSAPTFIGGADVSATKGSHKWLFPVIGALLGAIAGFFMRRGIVFIAGGAILGIALGALASYLTAKKA